ncbi:universal stress protein [Streptomyces pactum]|uniref:universal stress protein n=1 Tax=Streptomyces pactum TaxID=68249 RepID=UPI001E2ACE91|nr:universal stress protein [Streptomyces pactum]
MAAQNRNTERIVVGVDGSHSSKQALGRAVRQAELTNGPVEALTVRPLPQSHGALSWLPPSSSDEAAMKARAHGNLTHIVEEAVG